MSWIELEPTGDTVAPRFGATAAAVGESIVMFGGTDGPGSKFDDVTVLNLRLNEDGTLAATPRMLRQSGITDENGRYRQRVVDLGIAALKGCSPLKLPAEYYSTPAGGWNNINYNWQLR